MNERLQSIDQFSYQAEAVAESRRGSPERMSVVLKTDNEVKLAVKALLRMLTDMFQASFGNILASRRGFVNIPELMAERNNILQRLQNIEQENYFAQEIVPDDTAEAYPEVLSEQAFIERTYGKLGEEVLATAGAIWT